jgi:hypothetical protein
VGRIADSFIHHSDASERELAWAAGLFEGEGSIGQSRGYPRLQLASTDEDVVRRFQSVVNGGAVHGPYPSRGPTGSTRQDYKVHWRWGATGRPARAIMALLLPWLGKRRMERWTEVSESDASDYD